MNAKKLLIIAAAASAIAFAGCTTHEETIIVQEAPTPLSEPDELMDVDDSAAKQICLDRGLTATHPQWYDCLDGIDDIDDDGLFDEGDGELLN